MKILFVGNTCNYSSQMACALRNRYGAEVAITIAFEAKGCERDKPEWDAIILDKSIKCISFNPLDVVKPFLATRHAKFAGYIQDADIIHCFGLMAAWYVSRFTSKYIYQSYGDLLSTPFAETGRYLWTSYRAFNTRRVLKRATRVIVSQYPDVDALDRLNYNRSFVEIPIFHLQMSGVNYVNQNSTANELSFYFPSRHVEIKRLHVAISALCRFILENPKINCRIVLTDWGNMTALASELIQKADLTEITTWIPVQRKSDLLLRMSRPGTIVFDEFPDKTLPMSLGGISRDAVACGAVLISTFSKHYKSSLYDSSPPFFIVDSEKNDIYYQIQQAVLTTQTNLTDYKKNLSEWYARNFNPEFILDRYVMLYRELI